MHARPEWGPDEGDWVSVATAWAKTSMTLIAAQCMAQAEDSAADEIAGISAITRSLGEAGAAQNYDESGRKGVDQRLSRHRRGLGASAEDIADDTEEWVQVAKGWMDSSESDSRSVFGKSSGRRLWTGVEASRRMARRRSWPGQLDPEGIQRLLDNPDVSDYLETFGMAVADYASRQQSTVLDLCVLTSSSTTQIGTWGAECVSERREGSYARYYTFTLPQAAGVTIDLKSEVDAYLYLVSGDAHDGDVLDEDDDGGDDTDSRITRSLAAGTYAIEATTYDEEEAGAFTLQVSLADPM